MPSRGAKSKPARVTKPQRLLEQMRVAVKKAYPEIEDFDPLVELAVIGANTSLPVDVRVVALTKCAPFVHSTLAPVTVETKPVNLDHADAGQAKARLASMLNLPPKVGEDLRKLEQARVADAAEDAEVIDDDD